VRNCVAIRPFDAPSARRRPISGVRSITHTNVMLAMPTAPTARIRMPSARKSVLRSPEMALRTPVGSPSVVMSGLLPCSNKAKLTVGEPDHVPPKTRAASATARCVPLRNASARQPGLRFQLKENVHRYSRDQHFYGLHPKPGGVVATHRAAPATASGPVGQDLRRKGFVVPHSRIRTLKLPALTLSRTCRPPLVLRAQWPPTTRTVHPIPHQQFCAHMVKPRLRHSVSSQLGSPFARMLPSLAHKFLRARLSNSARTRKICFARLILW
jgi:hypothetical protein